MIVLLVLGLALPAAHGGEKAFAVVAGPGVTETHLSRETLALIFKRKRNFWSNGTRIQPVNLPTGHPLRRLFSQTILGAPPEAMEDYWQEMYFHGVLPPHVLASEEAVLLFVASTPGAIGYVGSCPAERKLNVILLQGEPPGCGK